MENQELKYFYDKDKDIENVFNQQKPYFERFLMLQEQKDYEYYQKMLKNAFELSKENGCLGCIDERLEGVGWRSAGSLILMVENPENPKEIKNAAELVLKMGIIKEITSHDGCGAAMIAAQRHGIDLAKADEYSKNFIRAIANEAQITYRHISYQEMRRFDFHDARICYYVDRGAFDPSKVKLLPGFVVIREINPEKAVKDVELAFAIASGAIDSGKHSFGRLITEKNPFAVVLIAQSEEELTVLQQEIKKLFGDNKKVMVKGFIV